MSAGEGVALIMVAGFPFVVAFAAYVLWRFSIVWQR